MTDAQIFKNAECFICSRLISAFTKIESTDRRVTKVVMPPRALKAMRAELNSPLYAQDVPVDQMPAYAKAFKREIALEGGSTGFDTKCDIWGARIVLGDRFQVISDETQIMPMTVPVPYSSFMGGLSIIVKSRARTEFFGGPGEQKAQETLREMISESDFRKYLTYGFILARGASGLVYQIPGNRSHTKVYSGGQLIEEICVRILDHKVPSTDNVIAFKVMVELDEESFRKSGNVYNLRKQAA